MTRLITAIGHVAPAKNENEEVIRIYDENEIPSHISISLNRNGDVSISYPSNSGISPYVARLMAEALLQAARVADSMKQRHEAS